MVAAFFGFLGSIVGFVALAVAGSVAAVITFILWKSGTLGDAWTTIQVFITGGWGALGQFWGFLRELVGAF